MPVLKVKKNGVWEEVTGGYTPTGVAYLNTDASTSVAEVFSDSEKTSQVFPETKTSAVHNENGDDVDTLIANVEAQFNALSASNITSGTLSADRLPTVPISKGGTGATTAAEALANLGGALVVNAESADYDMDVEITNGNGLTIYETNANTLGTPQAYGLTTYKRALIFNYSISSTYGFQLAFQGGGARMYHRNISNGTLTAWKTVLASVMNSAEYGTSLPTAGTKGRIFFKKA